MHTYVHAYTHQVKSTLTVCQALEWCFSWLTIPPISISPGPSVCPQTQEEEALFLHLCLSRTRH